MNIAGATPTFFPPHEVSQRSLLRALNSGDLEAASACFARDGCLITADATAVHGRERIRPLLAQLIARRTEIEVELSAAVAAGDVVLTQERWRLRSGPVGCRVEQVLNPTLALKQVEGAWRLVIAAPWGWAGASL